MSRVTAQVVAIGREDPGTLGRVRPYARLTEAWAAANAVLRWPVFSRTSFGMLRSLRRQGVAVRTFLDVGANKGQFSVAARNIFHPRRIHAFEPLPRLSARLDEIARHYPEIVVHPYALGATAGDAVLYANSHSQSSSLLALSDRHLRAFPAARAVDRVTVSVRRLDECVTREDLDSPVLLKIDTQGYELPVLEGASGVLDRVQMLVVETSFTSLYEGERPFLDLLAHVEDLGFEFVRPIGFLTDPHDGEYLQMDALFVRGGREGLSTAGTAGELL